MGALATQLGTALSNIRHHATTRDGLAALSIANKNQETYIQLATEAQEDERKWLSRELHDDTMQALVLALAQIDTAPLMETLVKVRRFCRDSRASLIDDLGLVDAAVRSIVKADGLSPHPRGLDGDDVRRPVHRYGEAVSLATIGRELGADGGTVMHAVKGQSAQLRPRQGGRAASGSGRHLGQNRTNP